MQLTFTLRRCLNCYNKKKLVAYETRRKRDAYLEKAEALTSVRIGKLR